MADRFEYSTTPEERAFLRAERMAKRLERQHLRRKQRRRQYLFFFGLCLAVSVCIVCGIVTVRSFIHASDNNDTTKTLSTQPPEVPVAPEVPVIVPEESEAPFAIPLSDSTLLIGEELSSQYAIFIDLTGEKVLAHKSSDVVVSPASMTKILTVLVAAEHAENLEATVTIDTHITDYCFVNECSVAGFLRDEKVRVKELFYGTILPSGADAALALAEYVAGSHEAFVELMNDKVEELGLSETAHFTNCVGLYNERNVCTVYDIAMILRAAMENDLCREVLTTKIYNIDANLEHPEGLVLSNWFLRRIEDYIPEGMEVIGAKTGYVSQAGNCAASIAQTDSGDYYICVTANTTSSKQCIQDHVQLYTTYMGY
ncbi:MAG: serine hydrolase [Oscillospiraceae bacterium]|nr:serine hydrolase [Oscillospiraceae bacterium]